MPIFNGWPAVDPGQLCHQISILKQETYSDATGRAVRWAPSIVTYAAIEPISVEEAMGAGLDITRLYVKVTINYQSGIEPNMRVQTRNDTYIIQGIENLLNLDVTIRLTCLGLGGLNE